MHSVDLGTIENTAGKSLEDGKYSSGGKFSSYMSSFLTALSLKASAYSCKEACRLFLSVTGNEGLIYLADSHQNIHPQNNS